MDSIVAVKEKYHLSINALNDINKLLKGDYDTSQDIKLRDNTFKILVNNGVKDLPMLMNSSHILENILTKNEAIKLKIFKKKTNYHGLGVKKFLEVIYSLDAPELILKNKKCKDYIIVTKLYNNNFEQIIVPIYIETRGNYNNMEIDTNKIKTVYGKRNINNYINQNIKIGKFIIVYNKK